MTSQGYSGTLFTNERDKHWGSIGVCQSINDNLGNEVSTSLCIYPYRFHQWINIPTLWKPTVQLLWVSGLVKCLIPILDLQNPPFRPSSPSNDLIFFLDILHVQFPKTMTNGDPKIPPNSSDEEVNFNLQVPFTRAYEKRREAKRNEAKRSEEKWR